MQYSTDVRNAKLSAIVQAVGDGPVLKIRSGQVPVNCQARDTGNVLATIELPADWMSSPVNGRIAKRGTWESRAADASGDAGHFRIYGADGRCRIQGTVGTAGADMIVDSVGFITGQVFTVNAFAISDGNG